MNRRQFLGAAGGVLTAAAVAGCTGSPGAGTPTDATTSPTDTATSSTETTTSSTDTTTSTTRERVHRVWASRSFTYRYAGAHTAAYTVTGDGPVFVWALVSGDARPALVLDDASHDPVSEVAGESADAAFYEREGDDRTVVAYELDGPVSASSGELRGAGTTPLDGDALDVLADPPHFEVDAVSAPERVQQGEDGRVTVAVRNRGGTTGTFLAGATPESYSGIVVASVEVPPGETATAAANVPFYGGGDERVTVDWGSEQVERTVEVNS